MAARALWLYVFAIACVSAQQDRGDLLDRVRRNLIEAVDKLPKYTCTQTIERFQYEPESKRQVPSCAELIDQTAAGHWKPRLATSDRLRLNVAIASGKEMYSWVGDSQFDNRTLTDLVSDGAISTGSFSAFLTVVFSGGAATFSYSGEKTENGRELAEFEFRVPLGKSQYSFGNRGKSVLTAFGGSFLVDPFTLLLSRLLVHTSGLPPETGACEAATTLDYGRVRLNAADFLLPTQVRLEIIDNNGALSINKTAFSDCHEFVGESSVKFEGEPERAPVHQARAIPAAGLAGGLPAGLAFRIALTKDIDTAKAAAGDPITGRLTGTIRDHSKVLARAGAVVNGRIVEVRRFYSPAWLRIGFKLETIDLGGSLLPIRAHVVPDALVLPAMRRSRNSPVQREFLGTMSGSADRRVAALAFGGVGASYVIRPGLEVNWVTVDR